LETAPGHRRARHRQSRRLTRATAIAWEGTDSINGPLPSPPSLPRYPYLSPARARLPPIRTDELAKPGGRGPSVGAIARFSHHHRAHRAHRRNLNTKSPFSDVQRSSLATGCLPVARSVCSIRSYNIGLRQTRRDALAPECISTELVAASLFLSEPGEFQTAGYRKGPLRPIFHSRHARNLSLSLSLSLDCRLIGETKKRLATFLPQRVLVLTKVRDNTDHRSMILRACRF